MEAALDSEQEISEMAGEAFPIAGSIGGTDFESAVGAAGLAVGTVSAPESLDVVGLAAVVLAPENLESGLWADPRDVELLERRQREGAADQAAPATPDTELNKTTTTTASSKQDLGALDTDFGAPDPAIAEGTADLHRRLALHSQALRLHLDHWADEQDKLLGLTPGYAGSFILGPPLSPTHGRWADRPEKMLGVASAYDGGYTGGLSRSFPVPSAEADPPRQHRGFEVGAISEGVGFRDGSALCKQQELAEATGRKSFSPKQLQLPNDRTEVPASRADRSSGKLQAQALRNNTMCREELFTQAHVAGIMNSTPGLRNGAATTSRLSTTRIGQFIARFIWCRKSKVLDDIERSEQFNMLCNAAIMSNTVLLTYSAEVQASGDYVDETFDNLETAFCAFYTAELILRVLVHRFRFFSGNDAGWHFLDAVLVIVSMLEQFSRFGLGGGGLNVSYIRAVRMLKILKVLRVLRVMRSLRELRLLLDSILGSARSLLWSLLVMLVMTFIFAICFVQAASSPDPFAGVQARQPWHSIPSAMAHLFMGATGGLDWQVLADDVDREGMHYYMLMFLYIGVFLFVIENALTSMFVEKLLDSVQHDETFVVQDRLDRRIEYVEKIQGLFNHMDTDGDGLVSFDELCEKLHDTRMSAFAASLDIDEEDLTMCFGIITANGKHRIDADAFVVGCIKLRGQAKSVDIIDVCLTQTQIAKALGELVEEQARFAAFVDKQFFELNNNHSRIPMNHSGSLVSCAS